MHSGPKYKIQLKWIFKLKANEQIFPALPFFCDLTMPLVALSSGNEEKSFKYKTGTNLRLLN